MKNIHNLNVQTLNQSQTVNSHLKHAVMRQEYLWRNETTYILNLFTDIYINGDYDIL